MGKVWGSGISQKVFWYVVKTCCEKAGLEHIAPHDLRRTCAKLCHDRGDELSRFGSYSVMHRFRPQNAISVADRTSGIQ
jgi:integrase